MPPVTDLKPVIFDSDRGQRIIVEGDTIHKRIRSDDPNPATGLFLEHGGRCIAFTFEDNAWWQSEYIGDANRIPQLVLKYQPVGKEVEEREEARKRWEQEQRQAQWTDHPQQHVPLAAQGSSITPPWNNQPRSGYDNGAPNTFMGSPPSVIQTQTVQMQFPTANVTNTSQQPDSDHRGQLQQQNVWQSSSQSWPNQHDYHPSRDSAPSPHFPETFPFAPAPQPQFPMTPSMYTPEPAQFNHGAHRGTRIDNGVFMNVGGGVVDRSVDRSVRISGQGHIIDISPDYHQELNGHYANGPRSWSRY